MDTIQRNWNFISEVEFLCVPSFASLRLKVKHSREHLEPTLLR